MDGLQRDPVIGFQLSSNTSKRPADMQRRKKAILWLTGGGYVTGYPLVDPILFSLLRELPWGYTILGPNVRKSLSLDRAFPVPLLDALAGYVHLREEGYEAEDIVVMGNSAGSGLSWSLITYLAAIDEAGLGHLGIPETVIMISVSPHIACYLLLDLELTSEQPWLSLPPVRPSGYPDLIDEPQLLNAARCYLARFPILRNRPDPFQSDWYLWQELIRIRIESAVAILKGLTKFRRRGDSDTRIEKVEQAILEPSSPLATDKPSSHLGWLEELTFSRLTSHHPFVSPSTDLGSPFVHYSLDILARNRTKMLMYCGTAEWFYEPAIRFANAAQHAGMDVEVIESLGGFHVEGCVLPPDLGGAGARLQDTLLDFLGSA